MTTALCTVLRFNIKIFRSIIIQEQLEALPELISRCLTQHQERIDQRRNFLHPDTAAVTSAILPTPSIGSPLLIPHSRYGLKLEISLCNHEIHKTPN